MRKAKKKPIKPATLVLILSNIANEAAVTLAEMFPPGAACLITASNFYQSFKGGICINRFSSSHITINGNKITPAEITGVISTISNFFPQEFYYIQPADREYVCAEMNALFTYFLHELNCEKLNPPSIRSFAGLSMHKIEWIKKVQALHIPIWPVLLKNATYVNTENAKGVSTLKCTIICGVIDGDEPPRAIRDYMHTLQQAFCMPYLTCFFIKTNGNNYHLADVLTIPDISSLLNRKAIVDYFLKNN